MGGPAGMEAHGWTGAASQRSQSFPARLAACPSGAAAAAAWPAVPGWYPPPAAGRDMFACPPRPPRTAAQLQRRAAAGPAAPRRRPLPRPTALPSVPTCSRSPAGASRIPSPQPRSPGSAGRSSGAGGALPQHCNSNSHLKEVARRALLTDSPRQGRSSVCSLGQLGVQEAPTLRPGHCRSVSAASSGHGSTRIPSPLGRPDAAVGAEAFRLPPHMTSAKGKLSWGASQAQCASVDANCTSEECYSMFWPAILWLDEPGRRRLHCMPPRRRDACWRSAAARPGCGAPGCAAGSARPAGAGAGSCRRGAAPAGCRGASLRGPALLICSTIHPLPIFVFMLEGGILLGV